MSVEGRRYSPNSTFSIPKFYLLFRRVFMKSVWWVCYYSVKAIISLLLDPIEAIRMK